MTSDTACANDVRSPRGDAATVPGVAAADTATTTTPTLRTGYATVAALRNQPVNLYSDLLLHHMGPGLADFVRQGQAGGDEFRTAPLWGVGQRIFFLHDGRAGPKNGGIVAAIAAHHSSNGDCDKGDKATEDGVACASEANGVIKKYNALPGSDQQDLVNFLRSL